MKLVNREAVHLSPLNKGEDNWDNCPSPLVPTQRGQHGTTNHPVPYKVMSYRGTTKREKAFFEVTKNCAKKGSCPILREQLRMNVLKA